MLLPANRTSSPRNAPARLFAAASFTVTGVMLFGAIGGGCERGVERADKTVQAEIEKAKAERGEKAAEGFQKAAKTANASLGASVEAKTLLAQAEVEQARQILSDVEKNDLTIARLASEITDIAEQVRNNNALIAGYLELSPKATDNVAKLVEAERGKVQGKGDADVWKIADVSELPAISNANAQIKKLEPQIKELEDKKAALTKQRAEADAKAADLLKQSKRKTGRPSVDLFTQSTNESKRSADLANEIGGIDHKLLALKQDLALAQAQVKHLDDAAKGFSAQLAQTKKSQADLAALVQSHRALSNELVYGEGGEPAPKSGDTGDTATPPTDKKGAESDTVPAKPAAFQETPAAAPADATSTDAAVPASQPATPGAPSTIVSNATMSAKAKELGTLLADTSAKRKAVADLLASAVGHYDSAIADAQKLRTEIEKDVRDPNLRTAPQQIAWKAMLEIYSPVKLNLQKANVQQLLAALHRDAASSISLRKAMLDVVHPALDEAGITIPGELQEPKIEAQLAEEQTAATENYDAADALLTDVIDKGGQAPSEQQATKDAQVSKVVLMHGRAQLARAVNDPATAEKLLSSAKQTVENDKESDIYPSAIKLVLGIQPAPAPGAATAPSTTRPARGAKAGAKPAAPAVAPTTEPAVAPTAPATNP